jgi:hypothetical protein
MHVDRVSSSSLGARSRHCSIPSPAQDDRASGRRSAAKPWLGRADFHCQLAGRALPNTIASPADIAPQIAALKGRLILRLKDSD